MLNCAHTVKIGETGHGRLTDILLFAQSADLEGYDYGTACGVEVEVRGVSLSELSQWLWDFDAQPIADVPHDILASAERTGLIGFADQKLYKTDAFFGGASFRYRSSCI
jgi:hypothetical protein